MDSKGNKSVEGKSDEVEKNTEKTQEQRIRAKRSAGGDYWNTHPHIVITGQPDKQNKPGLSGGGGGSLLAEPKPPANFSEKLHLESQQIANSTAKALEDAVKKTKADNVVKMKDQAQAQAKAKAEQEALTAKMKKESEDRLQKNREADAKREADRRQAEADREKAEAQHQAAKKKEAETKADAKSKIKADAIPKARDERFSKAGVKPTPSYTSQMVAKANTALKAPDALILNQTPGSAQITLAGEGVWTAPDDVAGNITHWLNQALSKLSVPEVSQGVLRLSVGTLVFHSEPVGKGSDKVPGRDLEAMFALNAQHLAGTGIKIEPGVKSVELPVRGNLVYSNGQLTLALLKTGSGVPKTVQVLTAVRDATTGLDKLTVPAMAGVPERHILINPAPGHPATPPHTGTPVMVPTTPVHTGTEVKPVQPLRTTTTPVETLGGLYDFIYWRPDASGTGVEPVYVMLTGPYGETNAVGKYSGRDYNTDKIGGSIQDLDWNTAQIDRAGVDKVKLHTQRFSESADNTVMIARLEKILKGELQVTDTDKRFYTHELRELERYRNLGVKDGECPVNMDEVWNNAHTATLEDYKINEKREPLYTSEAIEAQRKVEEGTNVRS